MTSYNFLASSVFGPLERPCEGSVNPLMMGFEWPPGMHMLLYIHSEFGASILLIIEDPTRCSLFQNYQSQYYNGFYTIQQYST